MISIQLRIAQDKHWLSFWKFFIHFSSQTSSFWFAFLGSSIQDYLIIQLLHLFAFCVFLKTGKKKTRSKPGTDNVVDEGLKTLEFNKEKERLKISPVLKVNETAAQLLVVESREFPLGSAVGPSVSSSRLFQPSQTAVFCKLSLKLSL